jgi:hypothetical protein
VNRSVKIDPGFRPRSVVSATLNRGLRAGMHLEKFIPAACGEEGAWLNKREDSGNG